MKKLQQKLKEYRLKNGLTQLDLAKKLEMTSASVSYLENGSHPSVTTIKKLSGIFKVSPVTIEKWYYDER